MRNIDELRKEQIQLERELADVRVQIMAAVRACGSHQWGEIKYVPTIIKGRQYQGDPEGTMGVDRQLPFYSPATTIQKWERTCIKCGETQTTMEKKKIVVAGNIPGTTGEIEVPNF